MPGRKIHIDKLEIRVSAGSQGQARALGGGLGREILHAIAESTAGKTGSLRIDRLVTGKVSAAAEGGIQGMQKRIAGRVAEELRRKSE